MRMRLSAEDKHVDLDINSYEEACKQLTHAGAVLWDATHPGARAARAKQAKEDMIKVFGSEKEVVNVMMGDLEAKLPKEFVEHVKAKHGIE